MTTPAALSFLNELQARDLRIWADGDDVCVSGPSAALNDETLTRIEFHRLAILAELTRNPAPPENVTTMAQGRLLQRLRRQTPQHLPSNLARAVRIINNDLYGTSLEAGDAKKAR